MDEARAVVLRLRRIEALDRERAPARSLLAEVRELLVEAEAWVRVERGGDTESAEVALARCRDALDPPNRVVAESAIS
jgi:hypothetical protein